jgi:GTP-binding protein
MILNIRNFCIVSHVDHGKSTLANELLRQSGVFRATEAVVDRVMDSNDQEKERGITILAKNASMRWNGYKLNFVDTPGHADFGGEVERTLLMVDGAILLVDAAEGPLPQTRFVLRKCLDLGFPIIVVVNKIDRSDARPHEVHDKIFDLFVELNATDKQLDFPCVFAVGRDGVAKRSLEDPSTTLAPLFEAIVSSIPAPPGEPAAPLQLLVSNVDHDGYVGRLAVGRISNGTLSVNDDVVLHKAAGANVKGTVKTLFTFEGLRRVQVSAASAGEIVAVAFAASSGVTDTDVGDTLTCSEGEPLPRIVVEEPTIKVRFGVNTSPFAGKCKQSKFLTTRHLKDRLEREARKNLAVRVEATASPDTFLVLGRGELQLAVLVENMRREGFELQLSNPEVVIKEIDGKLSEPMELVTVDVPNEHVGIVAERLGSRGGVMTALEQAGAVRSRVVHKIASRAMFGARAELLTASRGTALVSSELDGWKKTSGVVARRVNGALVAASAGVSTPYAMDHLQARGKFFFSPGEVVYGGMIVGEHNRPQDADVNVTKEKHQTNVRNHGKDLNVTLEVPQPLTIETAMEWIDSDELVEVTPEAIRVRKAVLDSVRRPRRVEV